MAGNLLASWVQMNLYDLASSLITAVNPLTAATLTASTGYTTNADGSRTPNYAAPVSASIQVQSLTTRELSQMDGLNIQGNLRKVWMDGDWNGIVRPQGKGADLLSFNSQNWLIVEVIEQWPEWTSVVVALQQ